MAKRFVLTAQLQLAAPNNIRQVVSQINRGLQGITANVNINVNQVQKQLSGVQTNLKNTSKAARQATNDMEKFGEQAALAIRRYGAFTLATTGFIKLTSSISSGINEAIKFDREMVRLSQVTGQSVSGLKGLNDEVTRLSKQFGVSSTQILEVSVTLAQAGLTARDTKTALEAITKTAVSATFGDIKNTTEAAIAVMQQFGKEAKDLESILGSINAVSARYAIESEDIAVAARRAGGAFEAAGGSLEEFQALFTSVRQTTRESAETIATGFRTIFTRLQRGRTQDFLKSMGIDLKDAENQFVGPYEAVRRLSMALKDIQSTDPRFSQIVEELGGFRQISKVIPLITKFEVAQEALNVAIRGGDSLNKDAAVSQQALSIQIAKVKEEFLALIRVLTNSSTFRGMIELTLKFTSSLIRLADALEPILPLLATFAAARASQTAGAFLTGFKKKISGFASGGVVPGQGNGDTVPAMLTPGEFVVRKKAVQAIGTDNLHKINKYASGGTVQASQYQDKDSLVAALINSGLSPVVAGKLANRAGAGQQRAIDAALSPKAKVAKSSLGQIKIGNLPPLLIPDYESGSYGREFNFTARSIADSAKSEGGVQSVYDILEQQAGSPNPTVSGTVPVHGLNRNIGESFGKIVEPGLVRLLDSSLKKGGLGGDIVGPHKPPALDKLLSTSAVGSIKGLLFEALIRRVSNNVIAGERNDSILDFATGTPNLDKLFVGNPRTPAEAKKDAGPESVKSLIGKSIRDRANSGIQFFANGGSVDTVPAMLTPGEFVINKKAASALGASTLNKMNNADKVQKFAKGGAVGAVTDAAQSPLIALAVLGSLQGLTSQFAKADSELSKMIDVVTQTGFQFAILSNVIKGASSVLPKGAKNIGLSSRFKDTLNDTRSRKEIIADYSRFTSGSNLRESVRNRQAQIARAQRISGGLQAAGGIAGAAGLAGGSFFGSRGEASIAAGTGGVRDVAIGGALSGAGTGAAIGSIFGPLGTAVGAIAGGIIGYTTSIKDAKKRLETVQFEKSLDKASEKLNRFAEGKTGASSISGSVISSIQSTSRRASSLSGEDRTNLIARFGQDISSIEKFFSAIATSSTSLNEFNKKTKDSLIDFSILTNIPFDDLNNQIKNQIDAQNKLRQSERNAALSRDEEARRIVIIRAFGDAVSSVSEKFRTFDQNMQNINTLLSGGGASFLTRDASSTFKNAASGSGDINLVERLAKQLGGVFGSEGSKAAAEATSSAKLIAELPSIIRTVQSQSPLDEDSAGFSGRLEKTLRSRFGNTQDITKILNKLADVQQGSGDDQRVGRTDPFELAAQLSGGITDMLKVFEEMAPQFQQQAERIKNAFAIYEQAQLKAAAIGTQIVDKEQQRANAIRAGFDVKQTVGGSALQDRQRVASISGGATSVPALAAQLKQAQLRSLQAGAGASSSIDPQTIEKYAKEQAIANVAAQRATKALEDVANSSLTLSTIQEKLAQVEQERDFRKNVTNTQVFGGAQQKQALAKDIFNLSRGFKTGLQNVNQEDRGGVLQLLESMPKDMALFGTTVEKVIEKLQTDILGKNAIDARNLKKGSAPEEKDLLTKQSEIIGQQIDALKAIKDNALTIGNTAATAIAAQNKTFLDELKRIFAERQISAVDAEIERNRQEQTNARGGEASRIGLAKLFGTDKFTAADVTGISSNLETRASLLKDANNLSTRSKSALDSFNPDINARGKDRADSVIDEARRAYKKSGVDPALVDELGLNKNIITNKDNATVRNFIKGKLDKEVEKQRASILKDVADVDKELGASRAGKTALQASGNTAAGASRIAKELSSSLQTSGLTGDFNAAQVQQEQVIRYNKLVEENKKLQTERARLQQIVTPPRGQPVTSLPRNGVNAPVQVAQGAGAELQNVVNSFSTVLGSFASIAQSIPKDITMQANHKVEVIINGAEMFASLQPQIQDMIVGKTQEAINKLIDTKFPDVGRMYA